jgi:hypothetical protein
VKDFPKNRRQKEPTRQQQRRGSKAGLEIRIARKSRARHHQADAGDMEELIAGLVARLEVGEPDQEILGLQMGLETRQDNMLRLRLRSINQIEAITTMASDPAPRIIRA